MAKIGASATIKQKKDPTPVQQATPQPVAVGKPLVTATTGPVQTYTPPASNGFAMTPQTTTAVVGPVQQGTSTPEEIDYARALALASLQQRMDDKARATTDFSLNKLNTKINKSNNSKIVDYRTAQKRAQKVSTINALQWLADYKAYRDTGSWNDSLLRSLTDRYSYVNNDLEKYGNLGASNSYWAAKSDNNPANPLDTMRAARETLNGPQLAIDTVEDEKAADIVNTAAGLGAFGASSWTENPFTNLLAGAFGVDSTDAYTPYFMTTQQTKDYNWILENRGKAAAEEYRKSLKPQLAQTYADWNAQEFTPQFAKEHPVLAGLVSVGESYVEPLAFAENTVNVLGGKNIDYTSPANIASTQKQNIRTQQTANINSPVGRFFYNALMSTADYASMLPAAGVGKLGEGVVLSMFGTSAANARTRELISQGVPEAEAFGWGLLSGAVEVVTEKISLDRLMKTQWKGGVKNFLKNVGLQGFFEGSEEVAADALNLALDTIRSVVRQEGVGPLEREIQELERKGATRGQATSQVILDHLKNTGLSFGAGAVSGGIMGGGATAFSYANLVNQGRNLISYEDGTLNMEAVQSLVERGLNMPDNTISHRQAELLQQKINEGKAVTAHDAAVLYANNVSAEKNMPYEELLKLRKKEADPGEWQAAKDVAMEHADELNKDVRQLYERTVEEAVTNGATGKQAIAEFDRVYTSGFNKLQAPQTAYISENTVQEIMQAAQTERTGSQPRQVAASRVNAERNLDNVNNYAENGSKVYPAAVREALDNGATEEQARVAFNEVYSNVYANKAIPANTSIPLSAETVANIRDAALRDRFASENKARANAIPTSTNAGVSISDPAIRQHVERGRFTDTINFMDEMGKRFGVEISPVARLKQNGQINLRTGHIDIALNTEFGKIIDRDQAMRATLGHELSHRMRQVSPKTWDKFTQAVIGADIDRFNADVNTMIRDTYKGDITRDAAQEEVLADYIGNRFFSGDIGSLRAMVESIDSLPQRSGFIQHIVDMASWIKSKLTGRSASNAQRIEDEFRKMWKETQAKVQQIEASEGVSTEPEMKESIRSLSRAMNIEAVRDENGLITFSFDGETLKGGDVTPDMVRETGIGALVSNSVTQGYITKADGEKQLKAFSDLMNSIINTQSPDMIWAFAGSEMFAALKSNSDPQYGTTVDFSTICRKTQDMITAMSAAMKEKGRGLTKDEIIELQGELNKAGRSVPCPVCYVFSRWAGVGNILDNIWNLQEKYKGYTTAELKQRADDIAARIKSMNLAQDKKGNPTVNNKALDAYRKERQEYKDSLSYELEKLETSKSQDDATQARMKEIREELPKVDEDINIVSEYSWVKNIASNPAYKPVPKDVLYDLDAGAEFAGNYPVVWKYRTTRGSGAGKAILPYSDMRLGDIILGPSNNSAMKLKNTGGKVTVSPGNKLFDVVRDGEFNANQRKAFNNAVVRARKQNLIGGQRFQSTSDFRYEYALDYLMAFLELQSIGGKMQSYTKVPEFADMVNAVGGDVNLSVMPKGSGLDSNGELSFSNVTGMDINVAKKINSTFDNAQIILVGINDEHIRKAMDTDYISFIIPWHASGASKDAYIANLITNLGEKYDTSAYQSYEKVQEDHAYGSADMRDIRLQILTNVEGLSREQLNKITALAEQARPIGNRSFDELREIETRALAGDADAMAEYRGWSAGLLLDLYHKMRDGSEAGNHLSKTQAKNVMPHEYWDKSADVDRAYVNGFIFRSYCQNLGLHPRFTGWAGSSRVNYGDFSDSEGYWKTLIDRPMYDNNGHYREQQQVNVTELNKELLTPSYAKTVYREYRPTEPNAAEAARIGTEYANKDEVKYSRRDSEGRTLTQEQAEFFADSKARDKDGNLLVLYHGTEFAGFNTFNKAAWMTTSRRDAGSYGGATRTYDPNEQRVDVSAKGGNFTIGSSLRFDTEQDRAEFIKNNPGAENYLTRREMFAAQRAADMEEDYDRYDELVDQEKTDERIRRAYYRYEDQHSETIPLKELIDNKELYTVDDFKRALLSIDSNASFDDEYDYFDTDEAYRDSIAEELEESFINGDEGYDDFPVRVRIPAGKASTVEDLTHIHNRIYEMYANVTRPYVYDAKGRGSEGNGAYYAAVQTALDSDEYDGAIINNIRVGRYQELGTVVVAKDSSQVKLVSNQNPTSNPDIRYSRRTSRKTAMDSEGNILTEAQAEYFNDSKIRDEDGNLQVVYHGTYEDFTVFDRNKGRNSMDIQGSFFSPWDIDAAGYGPNVQAYYLNITNPAPENVAYQALNRFKGQNNAGVKAREYLESLGYDGVNNSNEEYIAFNPEQIKLVDNQNPSSSPDIRYSKRASSSKDAVIRRQQETIDRLRHEMVETHGVEPDPKAIADAAVQFGRDWQSTMPETEIKDAFADIAKEFATYRRLSNQGADPALIRSVENRFTDKCTELANKVVRSAAVLVGDNARAQELKQFVWNHPIQNDLSFKKEFGEFPALREAIKGKIKLAKDGMPISRLYESLNEQFSDYPLFQEWEGETFEPVDMLLDLLDLINDFDKAYNPYDTADAVDTVAAEIMNTIFDAPISKPTFADRKAAEINAAKAETAKAREQARKQTPADVKAYYEAKLNDIREQRDRYLADLVQAYKDRSARAKESEERARLLRIMKRVDRLANKSSDAQRAEIKEIVGDFDLVAQRLSNHKAQELTELADWVRRNKDNPDAIITPQIADKLARLDKQHISDLRIGDVRAITEALQEIEHRIRTENRIIGLNERRNTVDIGKQIIQDVRNAPGTGSSAFARGMDKFLINGLMRPETEFLRLVGFDKNSPLYEYTFGDKLSLLTGQKTMQDYQREANEHYFRKYLDDKAFMKSITGKNARAIEITGTDEQGKQHTVKVTPDFVMAMYMHTQNVQNLMHICNYTDEFGREVKAGGMTVPDYKLYKDGKKTEAYNAGTKLTFTRSQFENQLKGLTPKEMEFIKAAQRYYSEMSQPRINDVSEKLLGYSLAKVDNYFRINTDPDYRGGDMENLRFDGTIEGMGWTKERVNGKNPILLIPLSEQLQKDIVAHSKYVGMAIPIRNFSKIYGITENTYAQNADGKYELQNAYASSVIKEINKKHPSGADTNYIRDLLADIQNPVSNMSALDKVFAALRSKYAGSVLTLNLGVALKQAASFWTAAAEIGWKPIMKAIPQFAKAMGGFAKPMNQQTIDFISKYSPLMRLRTEGMSTQELADMQRLNHKIPGVLNWIQNVDVGTVAALWKASEEYVKQNFKDLKPGSEEFYQKVGDVHTRVITKTQPNYSELQRPGLLRSKSEITKTLMMFKTQPFQNFNILYEAVGSFKAAERAYKANPTEENKAGRNEARKRLAWAVSSQVVSNSVFAAMQVIWDIMRRKEDPLDDEDKNVQRLNNFFKNMISSWAGMVPGGSQALEVVEKWVDDALVAMGGEKYFDSKVYGFELDASIEGLNKLVDLITNIPNLGGDIFGLIKGDENKEEYLRDLFKQFKDVSTFFGIPTNNVMNLTRATMEWAMTKGLGYSDEEARYLTDRYLNGVNSSTYSKKHYAELAIRAGEETMQRFRDDKAFDSDSKSAAEYLQEMQTKAEKDKFAEEYGTKEIYVADRDSVTEEAFREFAEKYTQTNDGNGNRSAHDILTALAAADLSEEEKEAIYDLYDYKTPYEKAAGKVEAEPVAEEPVASATEIPTRTPLGQTRPQGTLTSEVSVGNSQAPTPISKTSTRVRYSKDDTLKFYGTNEMYLDTNPLTGDRLDEFNRAYAAVTDNNDSVTQKELAAALNAMGVSLEEGEQIWAAYAQDHADKYGSGWKKTYANYYSGGSSGGSSGGGTSKSSGGRSGGGGGGRSSGGGGRSSGGSTQPVVGPYPGYSSTPAVTYTQPIAMPEPVANAPQTPYTGLQRHSEGGNVDLTFRPVLRAVELRRKGWGGVLSDTVRNFVKSYFKDGKALNFTPIVLDEDGKYVRTLSPNELREYAEAVLKGEREDDLKLQVGAAYEGTDALAQAEKAAAEIEKLDKDYAQPA